MHAPLLPLIFLSLATATPAATRTPTARPAATRAATLSNSSSDAQPDNLPSAQQEVSRILQPLASSDEEENEGDAPEDPARPPAHPPAPSLVSSASNGGDFRPDCADPHNSQIRCVVHEAACDVTDGAEWARATPGNEPPEAHDLRVDSYAKAVSTEANHYLHVDISWQMPPNNNTYRLRAFLLEVVGKDGSTQCFLFNVTDFSWTANASSPRFHFSTDSLFSFAAPYSISVRSLPYSSRLQPTVARDVTMVADPGTMTQDPNVTDTCKSRANPQAAKWTAGFRRIFLHAIARTIQIQFIAAPPQMCFEAYEVRLLDSQGLDVEYSHIVEAKDLRVEHTEAGPVFLGEHNFTELEVDVDFIPSVMPVERAEDGRCRCPVEHGPSDRYTVCSCIAADWKRVRLNRPPSPKAEATDLPPVLPAPSAEDAPARATALVPLLIVVAVIATSAAAVCALAACALRRYRKRDKLARTRFAPDAPTQAQPLIDSRHPIVPCTANISVLVVYAHDCPLHEAAVVAFAEFLRDSFSIRVHLDRWEEDEIARNLHDYVNSSVVKVDKVLVINSLGAYCRLQARECEERLERPVPTALDDLFEAQIDMAIQHARVLSMRFSYTSSSAVLFSLSPLLQYSVPENLPVLLAAITEVPARNDPRLLVATGSTGHDPALQRLRDAVTRMQNYVDGEPEWFMKTHQRAPRVAVAARAVATPPSSWRAATKGEAETPPDGEEERGVTEEVAATAVQVEVDMEEEEVEDDDDMTHLIPMVPAAAAAAAEAETPLESGSSDSAFQSGPFYASSSLSTGQHEQIPLMDFGASSSRHAQRLEQEDEEVEEEADQEAASVQSSSLDSGKAEEDEDEDDYESSSDRNPPDFVRIPNGMTGAVPNGMTGVPNRMTGVPNAMTVVPNGATVVLAEKENDSGRSPSRKEQQLLPPAVVVGADSNKQPGGELTNGDSGIISDAYSGAIAY